MTKLFNRGSVLLVFILLITSCEKELSPEENDLEPFTIEEIESEIYASLEKGIIFDWEQASAKMIWSAGLHSDSIFAIGYQPLNFSGIEEKIHEIDISQGPWISTRKALEQKVLESESLSRGIPIEHIEKLSPIGDNDFFPTIFVNLTSRSLIEDLLNDPTVRYVEPLGFSLQEEQQQLQRSDSGCSDDPNYSINTSDYTTIAPGSKRPWNFSNHSINTAWNSSTGDNIRIAIIDSGSSNNQDNLRNNFNSGYSSGRTVQAYSTKYSGSWWWRSKDSPNDPCGHGTSMAGLAAGPRSNDGNAVGVAYNADLMTIRAVEDVVISTSNERSGVRDALKLAGNSSSVKVISMSIGSVTSSSTVKDGIYYAYNRGKMIVAAAGTSFSWTSWWGVIFPANMSQTVAVTGVKDGSSLTRCNTCHDGSAVDFVISMQRASNNDRTSLSLASYSNQPKYIGGSSCATATTAGIAALVWAKNPGASRSQVMQALKDASQYYPSRSSKFGWGRLNAAQAFNEL